MALSKDMNICMTCFWFLFFYHMQAAMKAYLSFIFLVCLVIGTEMSCVQERAEQSCLSLASAELRSQAVLSAASTVCHPTCKRDLSSCLYLCLQLFNWRCVGVSNERWSRLGGSLLCHASGEKKPQHTLHSLCLTCTVLFYFSILSLKLKFI